MSDKNKIKTHFEQLRVSVRDDTYGTRGMYDVTRFDRDEVYSVLATFMHLYDDGSLEPAFLIDTPTGIVSRACAIFVVNDIEREGDQPRRIGAMIDVDLYTSHAMGSMGSIFLDPDTPIDELSDKVEQTMAYLVRRVMRALGHDEGPTATLRVTTPMAKKMVDLRERYIEIDELLDENPDTPQPKDDDHRQDLFEEQAETANELACHLLDLMPTMEVYN